MRITRRDAVKIGAAFTLVILALVLRRVPLVCFLALKILGHSDPLDAWKGPVTHATAMHAGIPIDVYGDDSHKPLLIVHGVNPTGKNSLDLVRISEALAQTGYQVFVPDLAEMKKLHLQPEEVGRIVSVFRSIGKDGGIACFSYGCGPALVAAAAPNIRDHVRFVIAFGGYYETREALEFIVTGPPAPTAYLKSAYLEANRDVDLQSLFTASTPEQFRAFLEAGPASVRSRLDELSPARHMDGLRARLIVVHGINDPVIPSQQSVELVDAARAHGLKSSLTLLRIYGHVNPVLPDMSVGNFFRFYLPEAWRFLKVVNEVIEGRS